MNLEQSDSCEGLITLGEIKEILKNTKHNKTPGSDGIPMEFYKVFLNDIWPLLIRSMNESFVTGELSITKTGRHNVSTKRSETKTFFLNLRPIIRTLLNCDYTFIIRSYGKQNEENFTFYNRTRPKRIHKWEIHRRKYSVII